MTTRGKLVNLAFASLFLQPIVSIQVIAVVWVWFLIVGTTLAIIGIVGKAPYAPTPTNPWRPKLYDTLVIAALVGAAASAGWYATALVYGGVALWLIIVKYKAYGHAHQ